MKRQLLFSFFLIGFASITNWGCSKEQPEKFMLSINVSPEKGGSVNPSSGSYEKGTKLVLSAIPASGYNFKSWIGDVSGTSNTVKFTISKDTEVTAVFVKEDVDGDGVSDDIDECPDTSPGEEVNETGCASSQVDSDNDGVTDDLDNCESTPNSEPVDENGCSDSQKDSDQDGVSDKIDECPNTPAGEEVNDQGCSNSQIDSDSDGVSDQIDLCDATPNGEMVDEQGCSLSQKDTDGDGINDDKDQCADSPPDSEVDEFGCAASQTDGDEDGVTNDVDQCPDTPQGATVDINGCADSQKDSDGDGINDAMDQCPNTPNGEDTNREGCSATQRDTDGDGVTDDQDNCSDTPAGEAVDTNGCSNSQKDSDSDGVNDAIDQCPGTQSGDSVNAQGCSDNQLDSDGDGIRNDKDKCENTPSGETVDSDGCSDSQKDSDSDGITDNEDQCPDSPVGVSVDGNGCSASQNDNDPPEVLSISITEITETSFTVDWELNEGSKGYIRFGTSTGIYTGQTGIENGFLTRHVQTVGGNNPVPLIPGTTYYWQIFLEDKYGNSGFSDEQTTTTLESTSLTFVPDDEFEQFLIKEGYDDIMDNYVLTRNIESVTSLTLTGGTIFRFNEFENVDLTGIEDFISLETLMIFDVAGINLDFSKMKNLTKLRIQLQPEISFPDSFQDLDVSNNIQLKELTLIRKGNTPDFSSNSNLEILHLAENTPFDFNLTIPSLKFLSLGGGNSTGAISQRFFSLSFSGLPNLESLHMFGISVSGQEVAPYLIDLTSNLKLKELRMGSSSWEFNVGSNTSLEKVILQGGFFNKLDLSKCPNLSLFSSSSTASYGDPSFEGLNLQNGNNTNLDVILDGTILDGCIQVDNPDFSATNWNTGVDPSFFSTDCGF